MYQIWKVTNKRYNEVDSFWETVKDNVMPSENLEYVGEFVNKEDARRCVNSFNMFVYETRCKYNPCKNCEVRGTKYCEGMAECECIRDYCDGCPFLEKHHYFPYKILERR